MGILSKTKQETEVLIRENDDLKNKLHMVLEKHQDFETLEKKLKGAKKELNEIILPLSDRGSRPVSSAALK